MASDLDRRSKEFMAALMPIVMPLVRGLLGALLALGMLFAVLTFVCAPRIHQHSKYDQAWEAFLDGLERYGRDRARVEGTGVHQDGKRIVVSGKIEWTDEVGLPRREDVAGIYDFESRQLTLIKIGRENVYDRKRDGPLETKTD